MRSARVCGLYGCVQPSSWGKGVRSSAKACRLPRSIHHLHCGDLHPSRHSRRDRMWLFCRRRLERSGCQKPLREYGQQFPEREWPDNMPYRLHLGLAFEFCFESSARTSTADQVRVIQCGTSRAAVIGECLTQPRVARYPPRFLGHARLQKASHQFLYIIESTNYLRLITSANGVSHALRLSCFGCDARFLTV
jgi:hypothetical protein